jgi:hypothetical protein
MVQCLIIEVSLLTPQADINAALNTAGISADRFLQAMVLTEETKNSIARVAIFYEQV